MQNNQHDNVAIIAKALTKKFDTVLAVDNLSLEVKTGEIFGLLGPNGAGKTTTIRMLSALIAPTNGEAWVAGYPLGKANYEIRRRVGVLTESPGLYDVLSAERNLAFFAELYDVQDVPGQVERYLRMLGLWERRFEPVSTFSKGMRQKLAIARALLHEPPVLFLDEPTSGLDPQAAKLIREFISSLKQEGRTIVLCTHNLDEADRLCDRIAVMSTRVLAVDTPQALRAKLFGRSVVFHLRHVLPEYLEGLKAFDFVQSVEPVDNKVVIRLSDPDEQNPHLIRKLVSLGADVRFVGELRHRLEDVYLHLINAENGR